MNVHTVFIITGLQALTLYFSEGVAQRLARLEHLLIGNASGHHNIEALDIFMLMRGSRAFTAVHLFLQSSRKLLQVYLQHHSAYSTLEARVPQTVHWAKLAPRNQAKSRCWGMA